MKHGHNRTVDWYLVGVLTYELIVGVPPYYSRERLELFENIKHGPLMMPKHITPEAKSFIRGCLQRIPSKRLGAINDARELKGHEWFKGIDWGKVYNKQYKPPAFKETVTDLDSTMKVQFHKDKVLEEEFGESRKFLDWSVIRKEENQSP